PGTNKIRPSFGTNPHVVGLLLVSSLACVAWPWAPPSPLPGVDALAAVAALGLAGLMLGAHGASAELYRGGFLLAAWFTVLLILAGLQPATLTQRVLESGPMRWAGTRSFALYLWHWPMVVWLRPEAQAGAGAAEVGLLLARLGATLLAAELSFRLVEEPLRRPGANPLGPWHGRAIAAGAAIAVGSLALLPLLPVPPWPLRESSGPGLAGWTGWTGWAAAHRPGVPGVPGGPGLPGLATSGPPPRPFGPAPGPAGPARAVPGNRVTVIGDSVALGARGVLEQAVEGLSVDAEVGRHAWEAPQAVARLREGLALGEAVVLHLGTNSLIPEPRLREVLQALADRRVVVLVTPHAPRPWIASNRALIERLAGEFRNVRVVDWSAMVQAEPAHVVADGVHPSVSGMRALGAQVADALQPARLPRAGSH
ncbi:MAG: acyltransferase family protein, partial [Rubrivivax sp.]